MKRSEAVKLICEKLSLHPSTVYSIIRASRSFSPEITSAVLAEAASLNIECGKEKKANQRRIGVAIPQAPNEFWRAAFDGMQAAADELDAKLEAVRFSFVPSDEMYRFAIEQLVKENYDAYIIYPFNNDLFKKEIFNYVDGDKIVFFESYPPDAPEQCRYIGPDHFNEGRMAAQLAQCECDRKDGRFMIVQNHKDGRPIAITQRIEGFKSAIRYPDAKITVVPMDMSSRLASSMLASHIAELRPDIVYAIGGFTQKVCMAVNKVGRQDPSFSTRCICHDIVPQKLVDEGVICGYVFHNVYSQGEQAVRLALSPYDDTASVIIESISVKIK